MKKSSIVPKKKGRKESNVTLNPNNPKSQASPVSRSPNKNVSKYTNTNNPGSKVGNIDASASNRKVDKENDKYTMQLVAKQLSQNVWYHGLMPRVDCEEILKKDGDFLVRKTTVAQNDTFCISVRSGGECKHIPLSFEKTQWRLKGLIKPTLTELIETHVAEQIKIPPSNTVLITVIARPDYYLMHEHITLGKKLGSGAFGEVFIGTLRKGEEDIDVAVKRLKGQITKKALNEFTKEAKLMRRFDHPNIVRMYGVAPQEEPIMIVLELAKGGALKDYLKKNPQTDKARILEFCKDACRGMCYLHARKILHRDLAARNCLLGPEPNYAVKISDFGLSLSETKEIKLEKLKNMPVKWLAPETLSKGVFSNKTDVWSFGVLVWEILNKCQTDPFPGETNAQAKVKILSGQRPMDPPPNSPPLTNAAMELCFTQNPEERPEFDALFRLLSPKEQPPAPPADE